jgi:hypothetical protein
MNGHLKPLTKPLHNVMVWPELLRIHLIPKVASGTINAAFMPRKGAHERTVTTPNDPGSEFRMAFVRHPADRLVSAWGYFCNSPTDQEIVAQQNLVKLGYRHGMPLQEFIEMALEMHNLDPHTSMQCHRIGDEPFDLISPLNRLHPVWTSLVKAFPLCVRPLPQQKVHASSRDKAEIPHDLFKAIETEFEKDVAIYQIAMNWGVVTEQAILEWMLRLKDSKQEH